VYIRKTEMVEMGELKIENISGYWNRNDLFLDRGVIGFCGQLFPYYKIRKVEGKPPHETITEYYEYDFDKIQSKFNKSRKNGGDWGFYSDTAVSYAEECNNIKENESIKSLFLTHNVPCFVIEKLTNTKTYYYRDIIKHKVILNPCLRDYGFQKIADPYTAMQDIHVFLLNDLASESGLPVEITDDKVIQKAKGFDHEYSFRQEPTKKNKRKKK